MSQGARIVVYIWKIPPIGAGIAGIVRITVVTMMDAG